MSGMVENSSPFKTPAARGAKISFEEIRGHGRDKYKHIRIEIGRIDDPTEYELNFAPEATEQEILNTPLKHWRVI